jgi:hypothetical protein
VQAADLVEDGERSNAMPKTPKRKRSRRRTVGLTWMLTAQDKDVEFLRDRLSRKGPL